MTTETLLLTTKDNHIAVLNIEYSSAAEKARKILTLRNFYGNRSYNDIFTDYNRYIQNDSGISALERECYEVVDPINTDFLEKELLHFDFARQPQNYVNELERNDYPASIARMSDTIHYDHRIPSSNIPQLFQNLGFQIEADDRVYNVVYNSRNQEYEISNFQTVRATIFSQNRKVKWVRNHFTFPPAEYRRLRSLISSYELARQTNPQLDVLTFRDSIADNKDRSLFNIYANELVSVHHRELSLLHELKHIKNFVLKTGVSLKDDAKRVTVEDAYRLEVEDERSAYLSQIVNAVNKYMKQGNPFDFSMFDGEGNSFSCELAVLPPDQRFTYASNIDNLLKNAFAVFEQEHRNGYDQRQFPANVRLAVNKLPLAAPEDINHEEFKKIRSLFYRFQLYNPATGRMEEQNFARRITPNMEVQITQDNYDNIINPEKASLRRRLAEFNRSVTRAEITPQLVVQARKLVRDTARTPRFINRVDDLEISDLFEGHIQPQTPNVPNDRAGWSDNLKNYWQQQEGYRELAKNNLEYSFMVKTDTLRYTADNKVQVGKNTQYDTYKKLLNEPSNKNKPVKFKENLTKEQAMKLYVACVLTGRRMTGAVPQNVNGVELLTDIPPADLQQFQQRTGRASHAVPRSNTPPAVTNNLLNRNFSR